MAVALAACGPTASPSPPPTPTPEPTPTLAPTPTATPVPPTGETGGPAVPINSTLLAVLPAEVDGLPLTENAAAEAVGSADPQLPEIATAFAAGLALDASTGQFVFAVVIGLTPGALDDGRFRDYRATFDQGACSQANGLTGTAEAQIDGRTVYIGTCAGGVQTYHVWLQPQGLLISASAVGQRGLGEILMAHLRP